LRGRSRWKYDPNSEEANRPMKQFESPKNLDAGEFGRIGGNHQK
jgi:hypothetical protein